MKDNPKWILGVGESHNIGCIKNYIEGVDEDRIVFSERAGSIIDVTEAMKEINSGNYWGILMSSLVLFLGSEYNKYSIKTKKFERFDIPPYIWRSGGLYVVEQACKKGLVTVVNAIAEGPEDLTEARRLGAKCFEDFSGTNAARTLRYFKSQL